MIFRRFLQRFKRQPWGAIATELVIVVVGVFIGIQVSNWNDERETNKRAEVFTERLTEDLLKEAWGYEFLIAYSRETNANQRRVLDAMAGELELSDEQFLISAYRATQYKENTRFRATYDELVSTGTIGLISEREMREAAVNIFSSPWLERVAQEVRDSEYRALFRQTVSAGIQEALLAACGDRLAKELDYTSIEGTLDYPCTLEASAEKIRESADALKAVPRLLPALRVRFADNQTALTDLQTANGSAQNILRAIRDGSR